MSVDELKPSRVCNSCGIIILDKGFSSFACPACNEETLSRCVNCRDQSVPYTCKNCKFRGP